MRTLSIIAALLVLAGPRIAACQPYVSGELGYASVQWPLDAPLNGRIDDSSLGYGIDFGIGFGKRWAFEVGAYGYGSFDATGTPCADGAACPPVVTDVGGNDVTIYKAALAPRFIVGKVRIFGTFGFYEAKIDTNLDLPGASTHDRGAVLGAGARWYFRDPWSITVQAMRFDDNLRQLMVGVGWGLRGLRTEQTDVD